MPEERKFSTENKKQEMNGHGSPGEKLKSNQIVDGRTWESSGEVDRVADFRRLEA